MVIKLLVTITILPGFLHSVKATTITVPKVFPDYGVLLRNYGPLAGMNNFYRNFSGFSSNVISALISISITILNHE